tara:strand:+ start:1173 stop:1394 length:222 start_codon:yes stop_codon:yes gene_type:complete
MKSQPDNDCGFAEAVTAVFGESPELSIKRTPLSIRDLRSFFEMGFCEGEISGMDKMAIKALKMIRSPVSVGKL